MPKAPKREKREPIPGARTVAEVLAENIRARRLLARLKQNELAAKMRMLGHAWSQTTVTDIERGVRDVAVDELLGLALVLEVRLGDLLDPRGVDGKATDIVDIGGAPLPARMASPWVRSRFTLSIVWGPEGPKSFAGRLGGEEDER